MNWTIPLFPIFGIKVKMHWILALIIVIELIRPTLNFGIVGLGYGAATMGILLFVILFHELSHCWAAIKLGGHAEAIMLWPLGGLAYVGHSGHAKDELRIAGIGPLSNFFLGAICAGVLIWTGAEWSWQYLNPFEGWYPPTLSVGQWFLLHAIRLNLILGLFNLVIPAYPLDGGRVLMAILTMKHGKQRAAEKTSTIGIVIGVILTMWGFLQYQFMLTFIGIWVIFNSYQLKKLAQWGELDAHPMGGGGGGGGPEFDYMPEKAKKPGYFARRRAAKAKKRMEKEAAKAEQLQTEVDRILEKVSNEGMQSLTPAEKKILEKASKRARGD